MCRAAVGGDRLSERETGVTYEMSVKCVSRTSAAAVSCGIPQQGGQLWPRHPLTMALNCLQYPAMQREHRWWKITQKYFSSTIHVYSPLAEVSMQKCCTQYSNVQMCFFTLYTCLSGFINCTYTIVTTRSVVSEGCKQENFLTNIANNRVVNGIAAKICGFLSRPHDNYRGDVWRACPGVGGYVCHRCCVNGADETNRFCGLSTAFIYMRVAWKTDRSPEMHAHAFNRPPTTCVLPPMTASATDNEIYGEQIR